MFSMPALFPLYAIAFVLIGVGTWTGLELLADWLDKSLAPESRARRFLARFISAFRTKRPPTQPS
jgi:hypothetical protein